MPETAILNERVVWDAEIDDNISPDYGFGNDRPNTRAVSKPAGGRPWSRETSNTGHVFDFSWLNRSFKCVQRVRQFAEQYEDGFFTIIDWDGGGRHYVGRFTAQPKIVEAGNDRFNMQGLGFEEVPGVPMLQYPSDWDNDAVRLRPFNDFGDQALAVQGTWSRTGSVGAGGTDTRGMLGTSNGAVATHEYRGYGFRLWLGNGPAYGTAVVAVDGVNVATVDSYASAAGGFQMVLEYDKLPLDFHRVSVTANGGHNPAASGFAVLWGFLDVMR